MFHIVEYYYYSNLILKPSSLNSIISLIPVFIQFSVIIFIVSKFYKVKERILQQVMKEQKRQKRLKEINLKLEKLSITDKLTQLNNRTKLDDILAKALKLSKKTGSSFSVIIADIDFFKNVNDNYGHQIGDLVLTQIASLLKNNLRETDVIGRWGGEEFLIIAYNSSLEDGLKLAQRLRRIIEKSIFSKIKKLTCSFGVTENLGDDTIKSILIRVDKALYLAKKRGRNRVEFK